ncbi:uncharacterized protein LOC132793076 [Drosophila nasuta]|uniref:uncharacterized protein LOC132793076 n=1 Tax=Drosophila nasuta TaxID=42062 RepID=UPI00295E81B9|nr:uncharacterized protein LOC132793076 [Drosophila nasuta]
MFFKISESANWKYELISLTSYSNDESKLKIDTRVEHSKKNDISGGMDIYVMFEHKDDDVVELQIYRSAHGNADEFKPIPYSIPKTTFKEMIEKYWDDLFYSTVGHCSNLLKSSEFVDGKIPQKHYEFRNCVIDIKKMPQIMPEGVYKLVFTFTHDFEWGVEVVAKVTSRVLP